MAVAYEAVTGNKIELPATPGTACPVPVTSVVSSSSVPHHRSLTATVLPGGAVKLAGNVAVPPPWSMTLKAGGKTITAKLDGAETMSGRAVIGSLVCDVVEAIRKAAMGFDVRVDDKLYVARATRDTSTWALIRELRRQLAADGHQTTLSRWGYFKLVS